MNTTHHWVLIVQWFILVKLSSHGKKRHQRLRWGALGPEPESSIGATQYFVHLLFVTYNWLAMAVLMLTSTWPHSCPFRFTGLFSVCDKTIKGFSFYGVYRATWGHQGPRWVTTRQKHFWNLIAHLTIPALFCTAGQKLMRRSLLQSGPLCAVK